MSNNDPIVMPTKEAVDFFKAFVDKMTERGFFDARRRQGVDRHNEMTTSRRLRQSVRM